ncbi:unnamed protein product [Linum tenue]|uniref:PB1-like domain-containing protein n=1 Tax=Linum tenue TaxID=586396 RepID=A0AAV0LKP1_9ROSI|nr:unnamed protein product [Linum tenue]
MTTYLELIVHHGGKMDYYEKVPPYLNGKIEEVDMDLDYISYFQLQQLVVVHFKYARVERLWYMAPSYNLGNGLVEIRSDTEVMDGLIHGFENGKIVIFMEGIETQVGDNEDAGGDFSDDGDTEGHEESQNRDIIHLMDDDVRTSDDEFVDALENQGIRARQMRVHTTKDATGEATEQESVTDYEKTEQDVPSQAMGREDEEAEAIPHVQTEQGETKLNPKLKIYHMKGQNKWETELYPNQNIEVRLTHDMFVGM